GRAEADRARPALGGARRPRVRGEVATVPVVTRRSTGGLRGLAPGLELVLGARAHVRVPGLEELVGSRQVLLGARPLEDRTLVPLEAEPAQRVLDADHPLLTRAGAVGVLDAEGERAAVVTGEQPVEERGADRSHVQGSGRGRREADTRTVGHERASL